MEVLLVRAKPEEAELQPRVAVEGTALGPERTRGRPQAGPTHLNLTPTVNWEEGADPNGLGVVRTVNGDASEKTFKLRCGKKQKCDRCAVDTTAVPMEKGQAVAGPRAFAVLSLAFWTFFYFCM